MTPTNSSAPASQGSQAERDIRDTVAELVMGHTNRWNDRALGPDDDAYVTADMILEAVREVGAPVECCEACDVTADDPEAGVSCAGTGDRHRWGRRSGLDRRIRKAGDSRGYVPFGDTAKENGGLRALAFDGQDYVHVERRAAARPVPHDERGG